MTHQQVKRNLDYIQRKVDEFKDGVTDAMIHGTRDEKGRLFLL